MKFLWSKLDFSGVANRQAFLKSNILVNPSLCYFLCFCLIVDNKSFITVLEIFLGSPKPLWCARFFLFHFLFLLYLDLCLVGRMCKPLRCFYSKPSRRYGRRRQRPPLFRIFLVITSWFNSHLLIGCLFVFLLICWSSEDFQPVVSWWLLFKTQTKRNVILCSYYSNPCPSTMQSYSYYIMLHIIK